MFTKRLLPILITSSLIFYMIAIWAESTQWFFSGFIVSIYALILSISLL